jgi:hypothetical protein
MEDQENPDKSDSVGFMKRVYFPIDIGEWILEESSYVFEGTPFLGHVSRLSSGHHELCEVTFGLFGQSSIGNGLDQ